MPTEIKTWSCDMCQTHHGSEVGASACEVSHNGAIAGVSVTVAYFDGTAVTVRPVQWMLTHEFSRAELTCCVALPER